MTFQIQAQNTGSVNPHLALGQIQDRISGLVDDVTISGASISGTGVDILHIIREGGTEVSYDESRKNVYEDIDLFL